MVFDYIKINRSQRIWKIRFHKKFRFNLKKSCSVATQRQPTKKQISFLTIEDIQKIMKNIKKNNTND